MLGREPTVPPRDVTDVEDLLLSGWCLEGFSGIVDHSQTDSDRQGSYVRRHKSASEKQLVHAWLDLARVTGAGGHWVWEGTRIDTCIISFGVECRVVIVITQRVMR